MAALADRERLARQPLGLRELARELRAGAAEERRPPQVERPLHDRGERRRGVDLDVGAGHVAELEQVDHGPARALQLELEVARLLGDPPQLGGHLEPLLDVLRPPQDVVAGVERGGERRGVADPARDRDGLLAQRHPPLRLARVVELERQPGEQPRAQRRVLLPQPGERLLEHGDDIGVLAPERRPRAGDAERGAGEQHGVGELARDLERGRERLARFVEPRPRLGGAEREQQLAAGLVARGARRLPSAERAAVVLRRLLPRQQAIGATAGGEREVDRPRGALDRRGAREVARELRQPRVEVVLVAGEDRLADPRVQPRPAQAREPVVERRLHERVGEGVPPDAIADLLQHPRVDRLVERRHELVARQRPERLEQPEVELAPDHARDLHRLAGARGQARDPARGDLAHALRHARVLEVAAVPHDLLDEERVALGLAVQRGHEVGRRLAAEGGDELGDLAAREPVERDVGEHRVAPQRGDQLRERVAVVDLGVAVGAEEHRAPRLRRPDQMAQHLQRRAVGPLQVVEHEQQRRAGGDLGQQRGEGVEQPLALDARVRLDRRAARRACRARAAAPRGRPRAGRAAGRGRSARRRPTSRAASRAPAGRRRGRSRRSGRRGRRRRRGGRCA